MESYLYRGDEDIIDTDINNEDMNKENNHNDS